ncbi:hypothetical protein KIN20_014245 [Parelaphostrongylus tenuis]|uniref:Uncharacterized protein n=1 Tax=Parelaphostrongylus tenuis TaxID=148309 RepID=A0AAD5MGU7_PARTN|nr:hypothetical protein KIN20_014245 [Parelaphostrongylus tenuis]
MKWQQMWRSALQSTKRCLGGGAIACVLLGIYKIAEQMKIMYVQVLGDFKKRRQPGKSREDYLSILVKDLCSQYGYNEYLMNKFLQLFPQPSELIEFLDANEQQRSVTIRTNTLKTRMLDD